MISKVSSNDVRLKRHLRIRKKINGTAECPRLSVFRSNKHIAVQLIDDVNGVTLASASSKNLGLANGGNIEASKAVGAEIAKVAAEENYIEDKDIDRLIAFRNNPSDESWITKK